MAVRVFISHSTHENETRGYLDALIRAIDAAPELELLVDKQSLRIGDKWREAIYTWLDQANAAVLLLSDAAQKSPWVDIESSILSFLVFRGQLGAKPFKTFLLLPVNISERIDPRALAATLHLKEFQYAEGGDPDVVAAEIVRRLCDFNREREAHFPPAERGESYIADALHERPVRLDDFASERVVGFLSAKLQQSGLDELSVQRILTAGYVPSVIAAKSVLRMSFDAVCSFITDLNGFLNEERLGHGEVLLRILNALSPAWISEDDALTVADSASGAVEDRTLSICTADKWVVDCLIRRSRGRPLDTDVKVIWLDTPKDEEWMQDIERQLYANFRHPVQRVGTPEQLAEAVRRAMARVKGPMFIVLPRDWPRDRALLEEFRTRFSSPTLMFVAEESQPDGFVPPIRSLRHLDAKTADSKRDRFWEVWNDLDPQLQYASELDRRFGER